MLPNAVVWVQTEDELAHFAELCDEHKCYWNGSSCESLFDNSHWSDYKDQTCYFIENNKITYAGYGFATSEYLKNSLFDDERPEDPRLFLCSVDKLIEVLGGSHTEECDYGFLDELL